jgi:hypothetical protein
LDQSLEGGFKSGLEILKLYRVAASRD